MRLLGFADFLIRTRESRGGVQLCKLGSGCPILDLRQSLAGVLGDSRRHSREKVEQFLFMGHARNGQQNYITAETAIIT